MIWIAIVDNSMGMLFNHRRQSRDRVLVQRILEITRGHALWMNAYTAALFEPLSPGIHVDERFYERAASGEFVLAETIPPGAWEKEIEKVILYHWNRNYPADTYFDLDLTDWKITRTEEFPGFSHDKITEEVYCR